VTLLNSGHCGNKHGGKTLYHVLNLVLLLTLNVGKWCLNGSSLFILGGELAQ
jgi:hypothetical protein